MKKPEALKIIADKVATCTLCQELTEYRNENNYFTVPGEGNANADLMILAEAPGKEEAEHGRPFIGRAGKLLDQIIEAAGWKREHIFITNTLKCRPPGNRDPEAAEATNCRQFLDWQIKSVDPKWILCLGRIAARFLMGYGEKITMGSLRGLHEFDGRKVLCTYHPSYLLRTPSAKKDVWDDIQPIIADLKRLSEERANVVLQTETVS